MHECVRFPSTAPLPGRLIFDDDTYVGLVVSLAITRWPARDELGYTDVYNIGMLSERGALSVRLFKTDVFDARYRCV